MKRHADGTTCNCNGYHGGTVDIGGPPPQIARIQVRPPLVSTDVPTLAVTKFVFVMPHQHDDACEWPREAHHAP